MKFTLVVLGLSAVLGAVYSQDECGGNEFLCEISGICIPSSRVCDGIADCRGGSDEVDCPSTTTTRCPGFECPAGNCIPESWICDGDNDCDNSDEENCPTRTTTPCPGFTCTESGRCLPASWVCDGDNDCGDNSDEQDCPERTTTPCPGFVCPESGRCLPASWVCDGDNDCTDWSDESEEACPCADNEIRCDRPEGSQVPGACTPPEYICDEDGIWDCPDGSDEANCDKPLDLAHPHFRPETVAAKKLHHMMKQNHNNVLGKDIKENQYLKKRANRWF